MARCTKKLRWAQEISRSEYLESWRREPTLFAIDAIAGSVVRWS
jgi:hypothetical protein